MMINRTSGSAILRRALVGPKAKARKMNDSN
jgi:hypothetical protein